MACLSGGNLDLHVMVSTGQLPVGQHIEIYGTPGTGKTALWYAPSIVVNCIYLK